MSWDCFERDAFTHRDNYENKHLDAYSIFYGNIYKNCNKHNWTLADAYAYSDEYGDQHLDAYSISYNRSYTDCYWDKHHRSIAYSYAHSDEYTPGYTQQFRHIYKHFVANGRPNSFTHFIGQ